MPSLLSWPSPPPHHPSAPSSGKRCEALTRMAGAPSWPHLKPKCRCFIESRPKLPRENWVLKANETPQRNVRPASFRPPPRGKIKSKRCAGPSPGGSPPLTRRSGLSVPRSGTGDDFSTLPTLSPSASGALLTSPYHQACSPWSQKDGMVDQSVGDKGKNRGCPETRQMATGLQFHSGRGQ